MKKYTHSEFDDEEDDELEEETDEAAERNDPAEDDMDEHDDPEVVACPYCGHAMIEEADICPSCGSFISFEDAPRRYPLWIWIAVIAAFAATLPWVVLWVL